MKKGHHFLPLYVDRLVDNQTETFSADIPEAIFQLSADDELKITMPCHVDGEAYLAGDFLILNLSAAASFVIRCSYCNDEFPLTLRIEKQFYEIPVEDIPHGVFDVAELVREELLVDMPQYPLCGKEVCLRRSEIEKYLRKETT